MVITSENWVKLGQHYDSARRSSLVELTISSFTADLLAGLTKSARSSRATAFNTVTLRRGDVSWVILHVGGFVAMTAGAVALRLLCLEVVNFSGGGFYRCVRVR